MNVSEMPQGLGLRQSFGASNANATFQKRQRTGAVQDAVARAEAFFFALILGCAFSARAAPQNPDLAWPEITSQQKPWAYWWWMGSAVDEKNIKKELTRYRDGGLGGVHIIPIYGARGFESNYISYLSPRWMEMMGYTVREAERLGLGVDMTTGTGWCFGGPEVSDQEANASVVVRTFDLAAGERLTEKFDRAKTQALVAYSPEGKTVELTHTISANGEVVFSPPSGTWRVYAISQKPSGQKVKRPSPGGEGWMLNLFYADAMKDYLQWFDKAFANYDGPKPRAQYHDSYEYKSDWSPDFFSQFWKRRGYRLQDELPALFGNARDDRSARVKCDYRETVSDLMADTTLPMWVKWSHEHGFITRNEAHGSPGNLLDLYAVADIPETEMFHLDRNKLISKFASSAAHVAGHRYASSETGTWLEEHFTETLADMKFLLDDLFLSGINNVFYHGTCYSPDEAGWPGWHFYASYEMNPRNSVWHDVPALNAYAARCQSVLQSGRPDNDILLYWPIHDFWQQPGNTLLPHMTVHARDWFEAQPLGKTAEQLWKLGYQFDYVSDRLLGLASAVDGKIHFSGGNYRVVVVPKCQVIPLETMRKLVDLAESGATVIFADALPPDVPGWSDLEKRRAEFKRLAARINGAPVSVPASSKDTTQHAGSEIGAPIETKPGKGRVLVGHVEAALAEAGVAREIMFDQPGLMCIRRGFNGGIYYFIANRGDKPIDSWLPLAVEAKSVVILDPTSGDSGVAASRVTRSQTFCRLQLAPGRSLILRAFIGRSANGSPWSYWDAAGDAVPLTGTWQVKFLSGGPEIPASFTTDHLASWAEFGGTNAQSFAGTARYSLRFDVPSSESRLQAARGTGPLKRELQTYLLDLGRVCQSARVRLNGRELGTLFTPPFQVVLNGLKPKDNLLEVEVTNVSANRIRDLDRRGVKWKTFGDINFVNLNYRPFDASNWPLTDSGLLGPVTLAPGSSIQ